MYLTVLGMTVGTCCIGLLPTKDLLPRFQRATGSMFVVLRAVRSFFAGGEFGIVASYILEMAPLERVGLMSGLTLAAGTLGMLLQGLLLAAFRWHLGEADMATWGWRVPFIFCVVPGALSYLSRVQVLLRETEPFLQDAASRRARALHRVSHRSELVFRPRPIVSEIFFDYGWALAIGCGGISAAVTSRAERLISLLHMDLGSNAIWLPTTYLLGRLLAKPLGGWLIDKHGVGWVTCIGGLVVVLASIPCYAAAVSWPANGTLVVFSLGLGLGVVGGTASVANLLFAAELFPVRLRTLGANLSHNVPLFLLGGLVPWLAGKWRTPLPVWFPGLYAFGGLVTTATVLASLRAAKFGLKVMLAHVRKEPYFGAKVGPDGRRLVLEATAASCERQAQQQQEQRDRQAIFAAARAGIELTPMRSCAALAVGDQHLLSANLSLDSAAGPLGGRGRGEWRDITLLPREQPRNAGF